LPSRTVEKRRLRREVQDRGHSVQAKEKAWSFFTKCQIRRLGHRRKERGTGTRMVRPLQGVGITRLNIEQPDFLGVFGRRRTGDNGEKDKGKKRWSMSPRKVRKRGTGVFPANLFGGRISPSEIVNVCRKGKIIAKRITARETCRPG